MIYSVSGRLTYLETDIAVIECGGVGFRCRITAMTARELGAIGSETSLFTVMNVRDDAIELFGFYSRLELKAFTQLTTVKGIGPKVGLGILSELSPDKIAVAIVTGDFKALTSAPGVGPKLAQRIILELKDKYKDVEVKEFTDSSGTFPGGISVSHNATEAVRALVSLGFTSGEASLAIAKLDSDLSVEKLVKEGLRNLSSGG